MVISSDHFFVEKREWESNFFARNWGELKLKSDFVSDNFLESESEIQNDLAGILDKADSIFELLEFIMPTKHFYIASVIEDFGFRLVDSKISFKTLIDSKKIAKKEFELPLQSRIISYSSQYLDGILLLTEKYLVNNPEFNSRFKNRRYFSDIDAHYYFKEWVSNSLRSEHSITSVLIDQNEIVRGYFIYEKKTKHQNKLPVYKGILTVVDEYYRGHSIHLALQSFLLSRISEHLFYIDNTTQLTNMAVITNHIRSERTLEQISLTFFRKHK